MTPPTTTVKRASVRRLIGIMGTDGAGQRPHALGQWPVFSGDPTRVPRTCAGGRSTVGLLGFLLLLTTSGAYGSSVYSAHVKIDYSKPSGPESMWCSVTSPVRLRRASRRYSARRRCLTRGAHCDDTDAPRAARGPCGSAEPGQRCADARIGARLSSRRRLQARDLRPVGRLLQEARGRDEVHEARRGRQDEPGADDVLRAHLDARQPGENRSLSRDRAAPGASRRG